MKDRRRNPGYSRYTNQLFMSQLSAEECGVFQEKLFKFRGFYIQRRTIRQYSYNAAAHALGDIGEVSAKEMEADEEGYYIRGDYVGKLGVEKSYEKYLRGEKGIEILLRDAHGRIQGHYMDGEYDRPSVSGKNLTLSLDIDLQMLGERLLKNKIGSIVAIEPETGEILCLVSSPNYDPHLMIGRQRGKNHLALQRDMTKPLLNRALMGVYPPGSTFKTAQGLTFLQEGIITEQSPAFPCSHGFHYGRLTVGCHAHGSPLPLIPAIATSCNSYFCWYDIEPIYYEITSLLVNKATNELSTQFYGEIFLAISDHIAFAIKRKKEKIDLPNVVLSETKAIYKKEYQLGLWAIKLIKEKIGIQLEEAEAGYIALHLVNFSTKNSSQNTSKIVNFVKDVFEVIEQTMNIKLELDSINYARLSTHLKFLAERVFRNDIENTMDTTENIRDMLKENIRLSLCINRIKKMIKSKYNYTLAPDEQTYLCIHIKKNCHI